MLKTETIEDLKNVFEQETELSEVIPELTPNVEIVNLDLIRIHINDQVHPIDLKNIIFDILRDNGEPGPLNIHVETAKSCRLTYYVDISTI